MAWHALGIPRPELAATQASKVGKASHQPKETWEEKPEDKLLSPVEKVYQRAIAKLMYLT